MAQYAILIYAHDSAHRPDATPEDTATSDAHADGADQQRCAGRWPTR